MGRSLQPRPVLDLALAPDAIDRPSTSGLSSCEVGQQSLYQPPVSTTSRLPSASSSTSVGWKSRSGLVTKSSSLVLKVELLADEDVPADLVHVEVAGEQIVLIVRAEGVGFVAVSPHGAAGPMCRQHRHHLGAGPFVSGLEDRVVDLAVDAAVDRVDQAVALAAAGMNEETWW